MTDRRYPDRPLVGVGAALFTPELDRVLLVQRAAAPARGQQPTVPLFESLRGVS